MTSMREFAEVTDRITADYNDAVELANKEFAAQIEEARQNRRGRMDQALADFHGNELVARAVPETEAGYPHYGRHEKR